MLLEHFVPSSFPSLTLERMGTCLMYVVELFKGVDPSSGSLVYSLATFYRVGLNEGKNSCDGTHLCLEVSHLMVLPGE